MGSCDSALTAYGLLMENEVDLLMSDIEMPDMSGLDLVKSLKSPPLVVFVTAHRDYALDCYEVSPIDFLLKPFDFPRFLKAIEKVRLQKGKKIRWIIPKGYLEENSLS